MNGALVALSAMIGACVALMMQAQMRREPFPVGAAALLLVLAVVFLAVAVRVG